MPRSDDEIRADLALKAGDLHDRGRAAALVRLTRDVEPLLERALAAERERDLNAERAHVWRVECDAANDALAVVRKLVDESGPFRAEDGVRSYRMLSREDLTEVLASAEVQGPDNPEPTDRDQAIVESLRRQSEFFRTRQDDTVEHPEYWRTAE